MNEYIVFAIVVVILLVLFYIKSFQYKKTVRLKNELEHKLKEFRINVKEIHKFGREIARISTKEEFLPTIPSALSKIFKSDLSVVLVKQNSSEEKYTNSNLDSEIVESIIEEIKDKSKGQVNILGQIKGNNIKSVIFFPFEFKENVSSTIILGSKQHVYDEDDLYLLTLFMDLLIYMFRDFYLSQQELQKACSDAIFLLANIIDIKDAYPFSHAERTKFYARKICQELNMPENITKYIEYAALLHDIGKITIDTSILHKPGSLLPEERNVIEKHPLLGSKMLEPITYLSPIASIILHHHEWYNGEGYPDKLKGEEIPLGSRIVAILDAYDAMISDRPYRKALSKEKAIDELKKSKNIQFDPQIVDLFVKILENEPR